jgi:hypothetical protein
MSKQEKTIGETKLNGLIKRGSKVIIIIQYSSRNTGTTQVEKSLQQGTGIAFFVILILEIYIFKVILKKLFYMINYQNLYIRFVGVDLIKIIYLIIR